MNIETKKFQKILETQIQEHNKTSFMMINYASEMQVWLNIYK